MDKEQNSSRSIKKNNHFATSVSAANQNEDKTELLELCGISLETVLPSSSVFTDKYMAYDERIQEKYLRLRKDIRDVTEQNLLLNAHLTEMKQTDETILHDAELRESVNSNLKEHLDKLKNAFLEKFADVPLPTTGEKATKDNIEQYIREILSVTEDENHPFYEEVEKIVKSINLK